MPDMPQDALDKDEREHDDRGCSGCGGRCAGETPEECRGPAPVPWLTADRCMVFHEARVFEDDKQRERRRVQVRVSYEHRLCLEGRQQGPLLYTTTLLPGETVALYEFDRYRRVRSASQRMSVHSSFRQTLSALSQSRDSVSAQQYQSTLNDVRSQTDSSISVGGGIGGLFGLPSGGTSSSVDSQTTAASGSSVQRASDDFSQAAVTSAQATEAERSTVVSTFEESEHQETTRRTLHNANECYAVTYYVRSVNEVYKASTRVTNIEWRADNSRFGWRAVDDLEEVPEDVVDTIRRLVEQLPRREDEVVSQRIITLPTDGTLYEAELAHCSSCEPSREEAMRIELEVARLGARRACLEAELLELEIERRRGLAAGPDAVALEVGDFPLAPYPAIVVDGDAH
jgi:hypothetical protein